MIKKAPASNIFLGITYTMFPKLLAAMSIMVWILDLSVTRYVLGDQTRFPDLTTYEDFCYATSGK